MVSWELARAARGRLFLPFVRQTKVKRLQGINNENFDEAAGCQSGLKDKQASKRGRNYALNDTSKRNKNTFVTRTFAWRTLMPRRTREKSGKEIAYSCQLPAPAEKEADRCNASYLRRRDFHQTWDSKTGKRVKSESTERDFLELFQTCQSPFVNELAPPTPASLYGRQSYGQSCDPAVVLEQTKGSCVPTNHVTLNVSVGNAWKETKNRTSIKTTVMGLFSRFKRERKTKVKKVRL